MKVEITKLPESKDKITVGLSVFSIALSLVFSFLSFYNYYKIFVPTESANLVISSVDMNVFSVQINATTTKEQIVPKIKNLGKREAGDVKIKVFLIEDDLGETVVSKIYDTGIFNSIPPNDIAEYGAIDKNVNFDSCEKETYLLFHVKYNDLISKEEKKKIYLFKHHLCTQWVTFLTNDDQTFVKKLPILFKYFDNSEDRDILDFLNKFNKEEKSFSKGIAHNLFVKLCPFFIINFIF